MSAGQGGQIKSGKVHRSGNSSRTEDGWFCSLGACGPADTLRRGQWETPQRQAQTRTARVGQALPDKCENELLGYKIAFINELFALPLNPKTKLLPHLGRLRICGHVDTYLSPSSPLRAAPPRHSCRLWSQQRVGFKGSRPDLARLGDAIGRRVTTFA